MMSSTSEGVPDVLVLAAIDRAERHDPAQRRGVPVWAVYEHLTVARRSGPARRIKARIDALEGAGCVERSRRHGVATWALSNKGRRRLTRALVAGEVPELPESPQHRRWREARTLAEQEIGRFHAAVEKDVQTLTNLLDEGVETPSEVWLEMAERLPGSLRRLASAIHCLREWAEPDEDRPDVDEDAEPGEGLDKAERARRQRRMGRRNVALWQQGERDV